MKHFTLLVLTFLFVSVLTFGQTTLTKTPDNIHFTMEGPKNLEVGEQFRLSFTLNENGTELQLPDLPNFDVLMGPSKSQSSNIQIINGKTTQLTSFSYIFILRAKKEGKFTIRPASIRVDGKTYESNELSIQVVKSQSQQDTVQQNNTQQAKIKTDWQFLNENSYSIQYPGDWDLNNPKQIGMSFILRSRLTSPNDNFRENVVLGIQDLKGQNINLDRFVEISVGQIKSMMTNVNIIENKRMSENGYDFQKVIFSLDYENYKFKEEQFYFVKNEKAYVLTLACEIDQFEKYKGTGEEIMNSFKLKEKIEKERVQQETIPNGKALHNRLITKYGDYWGNLIYKKEFTLGMTKEMILEFSSEKLYKVSKVIRNGNTIEIWEFDRHKMELETLKDGGEDGAKALLTISLLENLGFGNINSQFPNLEFTNGKLTGVFQN